LSKPDNWTVVLRDIINKGNCGRDKARRMVAELVELGYAQKEQARDGGRFSALSLVIYDEPFAIEVTESVASLPQTETHFFGMDERGMCLNCCDENGWYPWLLT